MTEDYIDIVSATLQETWKEACKEVLGKTEINHKMWLSTATWTLIKERKQMKQMVNRCETVEEKQEHQAKYNCHEIGIIWCTRRESPTPFAAVASFMASSSPVNQSARAAAVASFMASSSPVTQSARAAAVASFMASSSPVNKSARAAALTSFMASSCPVNHSAREAAVTSFMASSSHVNQSARAAAVASFMATSSYVNQSARAAALTSFMASSCPVNQSAWAAAVASFMASSSTVNQSARAAAVASFMASSSYVNQSAQAAVLTSLLESAIVAALAPLCMSSACFTMKCQVLSVVHGCLRSAFILVASLVPTMHRAVLLHSSFVYTSAQSASVSPTAAASAFETSDAVSSQRNTRVMR